VWLQGKDGGLTLGQALVLLPPKANEDPTTVMRQNPHSEPANQTGDARECTGLAHTS
jgi:hypothetical protein